MFRQQWQTMLNKCCLNGPVPTGEVHVGAPPPPKDKKEIGVQFK